MRLGAIVQARMSSERLPGKVLLELNSRPLLAYLLERLEHAALDEIVVATSQEPDDDAIERFCSGLGVACFRGALDDVAERFIAAAEAHSLDAVARVSGDSPLLDQRLVDRGVELYRERGPDLVSNVHPRSCPPGESVEIVSVEALRHAHPEMSDQQREHVTLFFYDHADRFEIVSFDDGERDLSGISLAVDSEQDAETASAILSRMERPHWEYELDEILELRASVTGAVS